MDLLQKMLNMETLIVFASGLSLFLLIYLGGKFIFCKSEMLPRLKGIQEYIYDLQGGITDADSLMPDPMMARKQQLANAKKHKVAVLRRWLEGFFRNISIVGGEKIKQLFDQAGWISQDAQVIFYAMKTLLLVMVMATCLILLNAVAALSHMGMTSKIFFLLLAAYIGWTAFDFYIKSAIKTRVKHIERQFPEVLDLMIICVEAGLSLNRSIERVAREIFVFSPEIARELTITGIELDLMLNRRKALLNLVQRVPSQVIRGFSMTLIQSIQQGTPLIESLDTLSKEMRLSHMQKAENKAAKLPSLLVLPLVLFVLPNIFIVLLGPAIVQLIKVFK